MTLVELLVAMVIGVIISGALVMTWGSLTRSFSMTTHGSDAQDLARDAVSRISREIRDMEPRGGASAITEATSTALTFTTTFNEAGNDTPLAEPVVTRYWYTWDAARNMGSLHRQRAGVSRVVADNLTNPLTGLNGGVFRYTYVDSGRNLVTDGTSPQGAAEFDSVSMVRVNLSLDLNPESAPQPMNVTVRVHLRNQGRY